MRRLGIIVSLVLAGVFVLSNVISVLYVTGSLRLMNEGAVTNESQGLDYHVVVLMPDLNDAFLADLSNALLEEGKARRIALEPIPVFLGQDGSALARQLEIAILSKVDGIILYGIQDPKIVSLVNQAVSKGIPVITLVSDIPKSKRQVFVGANMYRIGSVLGKMIREARPKGATVGLVLDRIDPDRDDIRSDLLRSGLQSSIKSISDRWKLQAVKSSLTGAFSGQEVIVEMLGQYPAINVLVCTTAADSLGAVQIMIDQNRLGKLGIIGMDETPRTLDFLARGLILGTLVRTPDLYAKSAVEAFLALKTGNESSSFVDPGFRVKMLRNSIIVELAPEDLE